MLNAIRRKVWAVRGRNKIKRLVAQKSKLNLPVKVILGSSNHIILSGDWINTDIPQFDITNARQWNYIFGANKIDNLLAEHVLEHLNHEQLNATFFNAWQYLKSGGRFRIAIPDKNNADPIYQEATRPGGSGPGADDHKVFLDIDTCKKMAEAYSFRIQPLEYCDQNNMFHYNEYDFSEGMIQRSKKNGYHYSAVPNYTSLIFDLTKE